MDGHALLCHLPLVGVVSKLADEALGGNGLGNDTQVIAVQQGTKRSKDAHEELIPLGWESHDGWRIASNATPDLSRDQHKSVVECWMAAKMRDAESH